MNRYFAAGLIVLGVVSLADLAGPLLTDGTHPPMSIALIGSALGLVSIIAGVLAWRGSKAAAVALVVVRLLSALTAVPAFTADGVPAIAKTLAGVFLTATVVGAVLVLSTMRRPVAAAAR
jgi:hypothetical protein